MAIPPENTHVAVVRLSALGDVTLTTGVLEHWHKTLNLSYTVITRAAYAPVFAGVDGVKQVAGVDAAGLENWFSTCNSLAKTFGTMPLIDLHRTSRSLLLASLWKGRVHKYPKFSLMRRLYRLGKFEFARERLERLNVPQRYALALDREAPAATAVLPRIALRPEERAQANDRLHQLGLTERPLVALHPYATHAAKAWPEDHWREFVTRVTAKEWGVVVVGRNRRPFLKPDLGDHDLTNTTGLRETCSLLASVDILVTGDSGPMHLATGVGTPVVALFGPTTRAWGFYPHGSRDRILETESPCRPCSLHGGQSCSRDQQCLRDISPRQVMDQLLPVLESKGV